MNKYVKHDNLDVINVREKNKRVMRTEDAKVETEAEFPEMTFEKRCEGAELIHLGEGVPSRKESE